MRSLPFITDGKQEDTDYGDSRNSGGTKSSSGVCKK